MIACVNTKHRDWLVNIIPFLFIALLMLFSSDIHARDRDRTKATGAIDAKTFEVLTNAQELTEAG
ncbi:MAG: hypothetical protein DRQ58_05690, partial [Gammaproteobacteria bacterium]